jgi:hypothetical protein
VKEIMTFVKALYLFYIEIIVKVTVTKSIFMQMLNNKKAPEGALCYWVKN